MRKAMAEPHQHAALHMTATSNGTVYETCECGASRRGTQLNRGSWHACKLCVLPFWRVNTD
jgi:hypothetical protein